MQSKTFKKHQNTAEQIEKLTFLGSLRLSWMRNNSSLQNYRDRQADTQGVGTYQAQTHRQKPPQELAPGDENEHCN